MLMLMLFGRTVSILGPSGFLSRKRDVIREYFDKVI